MTFLLNIFCSQCGGCYDEEKLISTSIKTYLIFLPTVPVLLTTDILQYIFKWLYMAGAGAEAKIRETNFKKVEPEINNFGSATLIGTGYRI